VTASSPVLDFGRLGLASASRSVGFGKSGVVLTVFSGAARARAACVQNDGRIIVVGEAGSTDSDTLSAFAMARYHPDGKLDPTFGSAGRALVALTGTRCIAHAVGVQGDGGIVIAGELLHTTTSTRDFALLRLTRDGIIDTTFGDKGLVQANYLGNGDQTALTLVVLADDRLIAAGKTASRPTEGRANVWVSRFLANGSPDPTFGAKGLILAEGAGSEGIALAATPRGDAVLAGNSLVDGTSCFMLGDLRTLGRRRRPARKAPQSAASTPTGSPIPPKGSGAEITAVPETSIQAAARLCKFVEWAFERPLIDGTRNKISKELVAIQDREKAILGPSEKMLVRQLLQASERIAALAPDIRETRRATVADNLRSDMSRSPLDGGSLVLRYLKTSLDDLRPTSDGRYGFSSEVLTREQYDRVVKNFLERYRFPKLAESGNVSEPPGASTPKQASQATGLPPNFLTLIFDLKKREADEVAKTDPVRGAQLLSVAYADLITSWERFADLKTSWERRAADPPSFRDQISAATPPDHGPQIPANPEQGRRDEFSDLFELRKREAAEVAKTDPARGAKMLEEAQVELRDKLLRRDAGLAIPRLNVTRNLRW
jgi:uncharacterized delta-60 repeat protein